MGRRGKKKVNFKRPKGKKDNNPTASSGGSPSALPPPPPWVELPRDVTENILRRLGPAEILENAEKVCTTWRSVCSEPSLWRVIDMKCSDEVDELLFNPDIICHENLDIVCRRAVNRSQGELIDINIEYFGTDDLLRYISERSSRLKCLKLQSCNSISSEGLTASVKNFPELEELHIFSMPSITARDIEAISICCPKLKSFTFNVFGYRFAEIDDIYALTIAKNMPNLHHLCLCGTMLSNEGLKAIFDGCSNLESLDIRRCFNVDLRGDFARICSERIKNLKPDYAYDSTDDYEWDDMISDADDFWNGSSDDDYLAGGGGYEDYRDYDLSSLENIFL